VTLTKPTAYWYAFECITPGCESHQHGGVVLEVRVPVTCWDLEPVAIEIPCPICGKPMDYSTYWPEDRDGYGASNDGGGPKAIAENWNLRNVIEKLSIGQPLAQITLEDMIGHRDFGLLEQLAGRLKKP
jgi:hypothetical protein